MIFAWQGFMKNSEKMDLLKDIKPCKIPNILSCIPEGTRLMPASSIDPDREGWIILPPEKCDSEEAFQEWKNSIYNKAIEKGLKP
jgi:hypothetical protein